MDNGNNTNILKVRDDRDCIRPIWHEAEDKAESKFTIDATYKPDWCSGDTCTKSELRSRIEPWLTSLFQSEHLSLLVGSGLTTAIQIDACGSANNGMNSDKNICEIGKERIRRAGRKIKEDAGLTAPADLDIGFRCLRLDSSNMENVYYTPEETQQQDLFSLVDNVKSDRTPEDLLFQVMLDLGVLLSSPIEVKEIAGKRVFNVADGFLLACLDHDVTEETVKAIAQMKPYYAVFRDSSMANDSVATNFDQIFETYSPETVRKVL